MPFTRRVKTANSREWYIEGDTLPNRRGPALLIPVEDVENLTADEALSELQSIVPDAMFHWAEYRAHEFTQTEFRNLPRENALLELADFARDVLPYQACSPYLTKTALVLSSLIERYESQPTPALIAAIRADMARNHDHLFVIVGQRDGFCCARCLSTKRLTLDHKRPVIAGGTNDPSNLQLLCVSCNSSKGKNIEKLLVTEA